KRVHIKTERTVAIPADQQATSLRPDIHLGLDNAYYRLCGRYHGQGRCDEGLMAHRDGTDVETQALTELPGPGPSGHDYPLRPDAPCRSADRPDRPISEFDASDGRACTDDDPAITGCSGIRRRY